MKKNEMKKFTDIDITEEQDDIYKDSYDMNFSQNKAMFEDFEIFNRESVIEHVVLENDTFTNDILNIEDYKFDDSIESISEWFKKI